MNKIFTTCLLAIALVMGLTSLQPLDWSSYLLHQVGTLIFLGFILLCYRYFEVKTVSFVLASIFIIIHIVGAKYLYSYVPYNSWSQQLFGINLNAFFGWQRNMYDRFVHLSYGLLLFPLIVNCFQSLFPTISLKALLLLALQFNITSSTIYELFEWLIAISLSPEAAEAYNGQQGDIWDAHKDILLALIGALISTGILLIKKPSNH